MLEDLDWYLVLDFLHLCRHMHFLIYFPTCWRCHHPNENWLCLCCKDVLCSRFINRHMLEHYQETTTHCVALSYRYSFNIWEKTSLQALMFFLYRPIYLTSLPFNIFCFTFQSSDLSVWCFSCDAYLDAQVILPLQPVYETAYLLKFGEAPPLRSVEYVVQAWNIHAESSTSGK